MRAGQTYASELQPGAFIGILTDPFLEVNQGFKTTNFGEVWPPVRVMNFSASQRPKPEA